MKFVARAAVMVSNNGIARTMLTVESEPRSQDEHLLLNLLKARGELKTGKTYRITIEEEGD